MLDIGRFIEMMPKVELHLHLEGAIPAELLIEFIRREGEKSINNREDLARALKFANFPQFVKVWLWLTSFIKYPEDFERISYCVLKNLALQNVRYVEIFCSPGDFHKNGLKTKDIIENIIKGKEKAKEHFGIRCAIIVDLVRNYGPEKGFETLHEITPFLGKGVIGIGLGGEESKFPAELFEGVYKEAYKRGFKLTAHAGETAGAQSIWNAITKLGAQRIGHAFYAYEDPKLIRYLAKTQLPLEICPTSNIMMGVCKSIQQHPVRRYFDNNLLVTVNSDDPTIFNTSLCKEYLLLHRHLNFTPVELKTLSINAINASFLPEKEKKELVTAFEKEINQLLADLT